MNIYINREINGTYAELPFLLDENYNQGTTWTEYEINEPAPWVLLTDDQIAFKNANPTATIKEVFDMAIEKPIIDPVFELRMAKQRKLEEIDRQDEFSNKFFISVTSNGEEVEHKTLWLNKELRNSLYSITLPSLKANGETKTTLWSADKPSQELSVPIDWAMQKLPLLEIYAKKTYDIKSINENVIYNATTIDEVNAIDVKANYPLFLTFELNLDL